MTVALVYLEFFGPPVLIASIPGLIALCTHRPRFGVVQIMLAGLVTVLPSYLEALERAPLVAQGIFTCSPSYVFEPWIRAISFGVISGAALLLMARFQTGARSGPDQMIPS